MSIFKYVVANAERSPEKTAIICGEERLTFQETVAVVRKCSAGMKAMGLQCGDTVAILLPNSVTFAITMLVAANLGLVIVPLNNTMSPEALADIFTKTKVKVVVGWHSVLKKLFATPTLDLTRSSCIAVGGIVDGCHAYDGFLNEQLEAPGINEEKLPDDCPFILTMTSGSTGAPKPIVLSQKTKITRALAAQELYGVSRDELILTGTPMYHSLAQRLVMMPLIIGGTAVILPRFSPLAWLRSINQHRVGFTIAVSSQIETIVRYMDSEQIDLSALRCLVSSSAPISHKSKLFLTQKIGCTLHECYGTSEIAIATNLSFRENTRKLHTVGKACPGVEIRILDNDGHLLPTGSIGEIACRTPSAFTGYYGNQAATAEAMIDGYFLTGDMGRLDEDGFLTLSGRKKEIIITGGINVYPSDVEACLIKHEIVRDCAVIGVTDSHLGEAVLAVVVLKADDGSALRKLRRFAMEHLADYQQPMAYEFVQELPHNSMGKIMKLQLTAQYQDYDATARMRLILGRS
jgi:long-chain acyl-CoA synthetase